MSYTPTDLDERQSCFIVQMLLKCSAEQAAQDMEIPLDTIRIWLRQPAFKAELEYHRRLLCRQVIDYLAKASLKAVSVLIDVLETETASPQRIKAAAEVLGNFFKGQNQISLESRMEDIESYIKGKQ